MAKSMFTFIHVKSDIGQLYVSDIYIKSINITIIITIIKWHFKDSKHEERPQTTQIPAFSVLSPLHPLQKTHTPPPPFKSVSTPLQLMRHIY